MIIDSMQGLGDNIYQRAFISQVKEPVYLNTPWPEIYEGLPNVRFLKRNTTLRTQRKNIERISRDWAKPPGRGIIQRRNRYTREGVFPGMSRSMGISPAAMTLPSYGQNPHVGEVYAVIRPCTVRAEWAAPSRNCDPEYITEAATQMQAAGRRALSHGRAQYLPAAIPDRRGCHGSGPSGLDCSSVHGLPKRSPNNLRGQRWPQPPLLLN